MLLNICIYIHISRGDYSKRCKSIYLFIATPQNAHAIGFIASSLYNADLATLFLDAINRLFQ